MTLPKEKLGNRLTALLTTTVALYSLATLFSFAGRFFWLFDLLSPFRLQYLLLSPVLTGGALVIKKRGLAAVCGVCGLVNLGMILPLFIAPSPAAVHNAPEIRAVVMNVMVENVHYNDVIRFIKNTDPDFFVIEEVDRFWLENLKQIAGTYPYCESVARMDSFGIALFSKHPLSDSRILYLGPVRLPGVCADITVHGRTVTVFGTHMLPPIFSDYRTHRNRQLDLAAQFLHRFRSENNNQSIIVLGDFNATPWCSNFRRFVKRAGLVDSSRGHGLFPSWPSVWFLLRIPIDHVLMSPDLICTNKRLGPHIGSDHLPLIVDIAIP